MHQFIFKQVQKLHTHFAKKIAMKKNILLLGVLTLALFINAQPSIEWQVSFGSSGWDDADQIQQTLDGGYILTGYAATNDHDAADAPGGGDLWVIKLNPSGETEWQYFFGGSNSDGGNSIQQTTDGGYIIAGSSGSSDGDLDDNKGNLDLWVVKLDESGLLQWQKNYGGSDAEWAESIQQTANGGYIVAGNSKSNDGDLNSNYGETDLWIIKLNTVGDLEWQKNYGGSDHEGARSVQQTNEGGFIVAGFSQSIDGDVNGEDGFSDFWMLKIDVQGTIEWEDLYGGSNADAAYEIQQTTEGGYIVTGWASSFDGDINSTQGPDTGEFWILKINSSGTIEWEKSYGGIVHDRAHSIQQTTDGGYITTGYTVDNTGDYNLLSIKLDSNGDLEWEKILGGSGEDHGEHIRQTTDGGYILCGKSWSSDGDLTNNEGLSDIWIVKLSTTTGTKTPINNISANVAPNPSNGNFVISLDHLEQENNIQIFDVHGKLVYSKKESTSSHQIDNLPKGIFLLHIFGVKYSSVQKIVSQ